MTSPRPVTQSDATAGAAFVPDDQAVAVVEPRSSSTAHHRRVVVRGQRTLLRTFAGRFSRCSALRRSSGSFDASCASTSSANTVTTRSSRAGTTSVASRTPLTVIRLAVVCVLFFCCQYAASDSQLGEPLFISIQHSSGTSNE